MSSSGDGNLNVCARGLSPAELVALLAAERRRWRESSPAEPKVLRDPVHGVRTSAARSPAGAKRSALTPGLSR